ncbi:MAG: response regulator [Candidatus Schekmanbacteria bacterium]|nr:response regulator [Candidatus Schekmanbacteria bacterium]
MTMASGCANRRILVIDDDPVVRQYFQKALGDPGLAARSGLGWVEREVLGQPPGDSQAPIFAVDTAAYGEAGCRQVEIAVDAGVPYAVAFVDIRMPPGWDGVETVERLWRIDPNVQVVIITAYSDYSWAEIHGRLGLRDGLLILKKPFDHVELLQMAHALTRKWGLQEAERRRAEELEAAVSARTRELEQANQRLIEEEKQRQTIEAELRLTQRLDAIGHLAAGIAHEINTPTQYVSDSVHFLRSAFADLEILRLKLREICSRSCDQGIGDPLGAEIAALEGELDVDYLTERVPKAFESALDGLGRIARLVAAIKELGHQGSGEMRPVDLNRALLTTLEVARNEYRYVAEVETCLGELPSVICLGGEMNQVFLNLIVNAAHAIADVVGESGSRGTIRVRSTVCGGEAVITIGDTGSGIPEAIRSRIFDPFFTTKAVGRGTGQGLAIARSVVVEKHGGSLTFESEVGQGTTFTVRIPLDGGGAAEPEGSA